MALLIVLIVAFLVSIVGFHVLFLKPFVTSNEHCTAAGRQLLIGLILIGFCALSGQALAFGVTWATQILTNEASYVRVISVEKEREMDIKFARSLLEQLDAELTWDEAEKLRAVHGKASLATLAGTATSSATELRTLFSNELFRRLVRKYQAFLLTGVDEARVLYETRTILGYAQTSLITSVSLFLPLLIMIWNTALDRKADELEHAREMEACATSPSEKQWFSASVRKHSEQLQELQSVRAQLRPLFWITLLVILASCLGFIYLSFLSQATVVSYLWAVAAGAFSLLLFLWLLTMLALYFVSVQPIVRAAPQPPKENACA